jgi:hypothetical protein
MAISPLSGESGELSVPVNKLVCTCRSVRRAAQEEQRINKLYVPTRLSREAHLLVMPSRDIRIVNGRSARCVIESGDPISRHDVSICILAERSSCWRRHREGFSEVMGDAHLCQDARTAPYLGTYSH